MMEKVLDMKLGDLINVLINVIDSANNVESETTILSKSEVLERYPIFTENTLRNAIKYKGLEFIQSGNHKYFDKKDIDNWIDEQKQKEDYNRFDNIVF